MPTITLDIGKLTVEQKNALIKAYTSTTSEITKIPTQFMTVMIREHEEDNIGVGGESISEMKAKMKKE